MGMEKITLSMEIFIKEISSTIWEMESGIYSIFQQDKSFKEVGNKITNMDLELLFMLMAINTKEIGLTIKSKEKESFTTLMELFTKEISSMIKFTDMDVCNIQTEISTKAK